MTDVTTTRVKQTDIKVGDVLWHLGHPRTVTSIDPYDGPFDFVSGVARDGTGWSMSLGPGTVDVVVREER